VRSLYFKMTQMLFLAAFHAMVIIAFVSAIPSGRLPKPSSPEPKENNSFDLDKEQRGYFTTGWLASPWSWQMEPAPKGG
jgi:hypothetical protein